MAREAEGCSFEQPLAKLQCESRCKDAAGYKSVCTRVDEKETADLYRGPVDDRAPSPQFGARLLINGD